MEDQSSGYGEQILCGSSIGLFIWRNIAGLQRE